MVDEPMPLEPVRTEIYCHSCGKVFVAELDTGIAGDHEIICPVCDHSHFRTVKEGKVTEGRYSSDSKPTVRVSGRSCWRSSVIAARTSTVSAYIRERWLQRSDFNGR
jgi:hypothetical protein